MSSEPPVVNIVGDRLAFGPLRRDLMPTYQRWFNDFASDRTQGDLPGPRTIERTTAWYDHNATSDETMRFTIYLTEGWQPIGMIWLAEIDHRHGTAYFGISISETSERGKGYGTEATRMILDYAFNSLGLYNIALDVYANNPAGIRAYQKAGFTEYARIREGYLSGGKRWDVVLMECVIRNA